ncbi:MAG: hypothetical protein ACYC26_15080 [Phycisphaerales bacterium]
MTKYWKSCASVLTGVAAAIGIAASSHATVIYSDDFSGLSTANLNATTPDTRPGAETWIAHTPWKADGSIAPGGPTAFAYLPFTPQTGNLYSLQLTITTLTAGNSWMALGFTSQGADGANNSLLTYGQPWILQSATNAVSRTLGSADPAFHGAFTNPVTVTINLDTQNAQWQAEWFINGVSKRTYTYTTNPTITAVGFGTQTNGGAAGGTVDNFSLTNSVPEPAGICLLLCPVAAMLVRRRAVA